MIEKNNSFKKVTKYKNDINSIPMRKWTSEEMNFFFAVLTRMRDEGRLLIFMDKHELAHAAGYTIDSNKRYERLLDNLSDKVGKLQFYQKTKNRLVTMPLFTYFEARWTDNLSDMTLEIEINKRFEYLLNEWEAGSWTKFMLEEFTEIKSTYSKTLFRLIKQWRTVGSLEIKIKEFRHLMDIPDSYTAGMINKRIVSKSVKDLQPYFGNLKAQVLKSNAHGTPIIGFKFTWIPEKRREWDKNKYKKEKLPSNINNQQEKYTSVDSKEQKQLDKRLQEIRSKKK